MPIAAGQRGHERDRARGPAARRAGRGGSQHAVVHHPCDRDRGAGAAHRDGHARGDRDGPGRAAALVGVHVVTTVLDPFAPIGLVSAFIPFSSPYRPLWLSLGTVAFDLLLAVLVTSLLRDRLSHRAWQAVHLLVYACWPAALWHGLGTGTDSRLPWVLAIDLACMAAVAWAAWWRLSLAASPAVRGTGLTALAVLPVLTAAFVIEGPLRPGWALRAGTPPALLGRAPATAADGSGTSGGAGRAA